MQYKLLDLFCCAGGAGEGYRIAGFDVTGIDINPQPNHRGKFVQSDALQFLKDHGHEYDVIHASPPCQAYSFASAPHRANGKIYPDLIASTREALVKSGKPYIIENVPGAPLIRPVILCGSMFEARGGGLLRTYRHRLFESNIDFVVPPCFHMYPIAKMGRFPKPNEFWHFVGHFANAREAKRMLGLEWFTQREIAQCIPPQYTEFLGKQIIAHLNGTTDRTLRECLKLNRAAQAA